MVASNAVAFNSDTVQDIPKSDLACAMTSEALIADHDGMFSVMLRCCTCRVLANILEPSIPFVWIRRHVPHHYVQWYTAILPLSTAGQPHEVEVRSLQFDIQLSTQRFIELLSEFEEHGIDLCQMTRRVPDTLTLHGISDAMVSRILCQNGLHLRFFLPHAGECAQLASPYREVLVNALRRPEVRELAYR